MDNEIPQPEAESSPAVLPAELKFILEALLFSAQKPLSLKEIRDALAGAVEHAEGDARAAAFKKVREPEMIATLEELARDHDAAARSYRLACIAGSWQFVTLPDYAPWLKALVGVKARPPRLSQAALETMAIIAYRQPITRAEVEQIRGVSVDGTMQTLIERGLVEQTGRAEAVGRPALYGTTAVFLEYFGLRSLDDLPAAEELRRIVIEKPAAPLTADPGLATVPPEPLKSAEQSVVVETLPEATESSPATDKPTAD
ncbi:MAG TPA: SMC-Scp complex subunit ScpB [Verrucomicrobiae bacterium]|nr:SMC-Scp complex subunit ScpB [Verrucomicrobiae bacterium]